MTRIYILEDDLTIIDNLTRIIRDEQLGIVCGDSADGTPTTAEILATRPDLIMLDFLMPDRDGVEVAADLRAHGCNAKCVMLSQISSKEMIGKAYAAGVDFFISKPINVLEVCSVIRNINKQIENEQLLDNIKSMFQVPGQMVTSPVTGKDIQGKKRYLQSILSALGMSGEKGSADIVQMVLYLYENNLTMTDIGMAQLCESVSDSPKNAEQRARRAVAAGMVNLAHMGCEDYEGETFNQYAGRLFPFEELRMEMDHIRGKRETGGKVSLKRFLDGLVVYLREY